MFSLFLQTSTPSLLDRRPEKQKFMPTSRDNLLKLLEDKAKSEKIVDGVLLHIAQVILMTRNSLIILVQFVRESQELYAR